MASSLKRLFLAFLLVLAVSPPDVLARESRAFNKFVPSGTPTEPVVIPEESPAVQVAKAAKFGRDFPTTTAAAASTSNGDGARYNAYVFPSRFPNNELYSKDANYDKGYSNEGQQSYNHNTNGGGYRNKVSPTTSYPSHAYNNEGYGMSDTRLLGGGKYYYDVSSEKGYGAYAGIGVHDNYRRTDPNREENTYEYNNAVEGNQYNREGQGKEYVP